MTNVSIGAFLESSFRPTFSMAAKTALPGGSDAFPVGAPVVCGDAPAGPPKGLLAMPDAAATSAGIVLIRAFLYTSHGRSSVIL